MEPELKRSKQLYYLLISFAVFILHFLWEIRAEKGYKMKRVPQIIKSSNFTCITTMSDKRFPDTSIYSRPLMYDCFYSLLFYADDNSQTCRNIRINPYGNVTFCNHEKNEMACLKGRFELMEIEDFPEFQITPYQLALSHQNPVIIKFEAFSVKIRTDLITKKHIIKK